MKPRLLRVDQTELNDLRQRLVKMVASKSTYTAEEYGPAGIDSNPIKGSTAMYVLTERDGDEGVVAYLIKEKKAEPGETRLFSTDADGAFKFNVWLLADGTMLIGDSDTPGDYDNFLVKFNELKTEFNKLKTDYNNLVTTFNAHTHVLALSAGTGTAAPPATPGSSNTSNIDNAKAEKIKTV